MFYSISTFTTKNCINFDKHVSNVCCQVMKKYLAVWSQMTLYTRQKEPQVVNKHNNNNNNNACLVNSILASGIEYWVFKK